MTTTAPPTYHQKDPALYHSKESTTKRADRTAELAERYINIGWVIVQAHAPIFSTSGRVGCTCEAYYRSDKCRDDGNHNYNPDYICPNPGKHPYGKWKDITEVMSLKKALAIFGRPQKVVDVDTGQKVYVAWNIGILTGPSNVLTQDADTYKNHYHCELSDLIPIEDQETPQQLSQSGGLHLVFDREGKPYTNANDELKAAGIEGVDIRGEGGFQVIEPSLGPSGNEYAWVEGYEPWTVALRPIPAELDRLLATAAGKRSNPAQPVQFTTPTTEKPDLAQWGLHPKIMYLLHNPPPKGQRSEADQKVITALIHHGATDDAILAFFEHLPIGTQGRFAEKGRDYLARSIGKARQYVEDHPTVNDGGVDDMAANNGFGQTPAISLNGHVSGTVYTNGHSSSTATKSAKLAMSPGRRIKHTKDGETRIVKILSLNTVLTVDGGPNVYDAEYADDTGATWPITVSDDDDITLMTADAPAPKTSAWHEIAKEIARITAAYETPEDRQTHIVEELSAYIAACERSKHTLLIAALQNANAGFTKTSASKFIDNCVRDAKQAAKQQPQKTDAEIAAESNINTWPYGVEDGCIVEYWTNDEGEIQHTKLCNFNAWIVADVAVDDGEGITRKIVIGGKLGNGTPLPEVEIKADEFESMQWVVASWGARANIAPGKGSKDTLRHAIQTLSADNMQQRNSRAHTGWAVIDGNRVFVHNDGAVGGEGIKVSLPQQLHGYRFPTDNAVDPVAAMRESIALMDVANAKISAPLWAAMYLAPLSEFIAPVFTISVEGGSGSYKSSYSAVMLCHYGPKFEENKSMPADWLGTANSLEKLCHHAKDVPLIIDDLRPTPSPSEHKELMAKVNHIVRAVGNRQGRSRLDSNSDFKRTYAPRGVVIMTAERKAMGKSTNSRILTLDVEPGDIDGFKLAVAQRQRHIYGYAMAGFIQWVADNWSDLENDLPNAVIDIRTKHSVDGQHKRLPNATAVLYVAFETAMTYAIEIGAITEEDAASRLSALETALSGIAETQNEATEEEDPALKYITIIATLIAQEKAYLQPKGDKMNGKNLGSSFAERLGWYDSHNVFLLPGAYNAVCKYASAEGWIFPSDEPTLRKELNRAGFITKTDVGKLTSLQRAPGDTRTRVPVLAISYAKFGEVLKAMGVDVP